MTKKAPPVAEPSQRLMPLDLRCYAAAANNACDACGCESCDSAAAYRYGCLSGRCRSRDLAA
jgi:hypothetical protein